MMFAAKLFAGGRRTGWRAKMRKGLMLAAALMMPMGSVVPMQSAGAADFMPSFSLSQNNGPSIEIMVQHVVMVDPDIAVIYVEIEGKGKTSDAALQALRPVANKVIDAIRPFAQKPDDFETVASSVGEETKWVDEERVKLGYIARTRVKMTIRDFDQIFP